MYSGSDSTESHKYPQWAMNPAAYQNMANDQVDWAALAQQWIIMKEAGPPPIPGEQPIVLNNKLPKVGREGGEAPMEMENDKEEAPSWNVTEPPPPPGAEPWNWNAQSQNWNWNNSWVPPSAVPPPPTIGPLKPPLLPTPNNMFSAPPESSSDNAVPFGGYNHSGSNNEFNSNYWTGSSSHKHIKPHNKRYSKVNVPIRAAAPVAPVVVPVETPMVPALDAAKRKQLPAWIREGLEKMEKDKLKQLEREREKLERDEYMVKNKQNEKETMEILKTTMKERQRSKFESDGENSDYEGDVRKKSSTPERIALTPDELMLKVRRMMTEILLNVTSRQIDTICREEYQRYVKKYKASDHRSSAPSGANISARLGLGIYGDGSGSSSEEEDNYLNRDSRDSDCELKETIKKRMVEFQKTEREIEDKLEEAERRKAGSVSRSASPESNDNDSQVDARAQGRRHHSDDKSPPRSRTVIDKSKQRSFSSSSDGSDYSNNRSKNSRRSSSSDSVDSHKRQKKKHRSRADSQSPDKKHKSSLSSRWSRSKSPSKRHSRSDSRSRRDSTNSKKKSRRSRSSSYSRSRRSRSSSYVRSKRSRSRDRSRRSRSRNRSTSRSRYSKKSRSRSRSNSRRARRRRSRSSSSGRGKRSHRN